MAPLVELRDLRVYFDVRAGLLRTVPLKAVDGVSLKIDAAETVALVGESGSGKTTLGRAILRLVPATSGQVLFDGDDISGWKGEKLKAFRRRAQAIFQDPYSTISAYMKVQEVVEEPLTIHRDSLSPGDASLRERVRAALNQVKLTPADDVAQKYPHQLSGGQRQRTAIARALVLEPQFIVADEPVSMVDASNRAEILTLMRDLQRQRGIAFLYVTHDVASAYHFSDRIAVMYLGTLVESGPTRVVIDKPLHPYTQGLLAAVPQADPANRRSLRPVIAGEPPDAIHPPLGCPFVSRCPKAIEGVCNARRPQLTEVEAGHEVACFLY